jgi:hypothetical protein
VPSGELTKTSFALTDAKKQVLTTIKLTTNLFMMLEKFLIIDFECKGRALINQLQAEQTNIKVVSKGTVRY